MKQKLFVLSMDAMVFEDLEYMAKKPNFQKLFSKCAQVEKVMSIFPAITYPCHTTLLTGCNPGKHGIYNNYAFKDYDDNIRRWYLYKKYVRVEDVFAAAKRAGCTTAAVYWPICGCNPNIDHIINEYFFYYPDEDFEEAFRRMGASDTALEVVRENIDVLQARRAGDKSLSIDHFTMRCVCSMIRKAKPDVLFVHNCTPDTFRHRHGVFAEEIKVALDRTDAWLGDVIAAMEEAGVYEDTNFVLLSDHGQMDYTRRIRLNALLVEGGFIDVAPNGAVYDWQAFSQSNGMSATVYLRDPDNKAVYDKVYAYLQELVASGKYGLSRVYTTAEAKEKYGTYGPFSFIVATDGKTSISQEWNKETVEELGDSELCPVKGNHGHEPELGPQPIFVARGPAFKEGAVLKNARLIDVAPTLAAVFGQNMPEAEGRCLTELLK